jgi:hypothetical protein
MKKKLATLLAGMLLVTLPALGKNYRAPAEDAQDWGVHDDGLLWLKVWNSGAVGDTMGGSGIYPAPNGPANIYAGYFLAGTIIKNKIYVSGGVSFGSSRKGGWYGLTPVIMSRDPEWVQVPSYIKREGTLDSYYQMDDSDAGEGGPIPVACDVHGVSWYLDDYDDFIAFRYHVKNDSPQTLEKTYFALAYDFDIGGSLSYIDDYVGFDDERKMPYMYDGDPGNPYLGLVCLEGPVRGAHSWDIMNDPENDRYLYAYMADPSFDCERTKPYDWRVMLSTGPYEIPAGLTEVVTFAVVAGADLEALLDNADTALAAFKLGPPPERAVPAAFNLAQNRPNPVKTATKIRFSCRVSAKVKLAVYDLAGRRVATLADKIYPPGVYEVEWRPQNVAPGVYLYTLEAVNERFVKAMVVAR